MRAHIVILISLEVNTEADLLLVAYSHPLFQTSIILLDLLLVPDCTTYNSFLTSFFFLEKSKSNHKVIVK